MFGSLPQPTHTPCPDCGAPVPRDGRHEHECSEAQRVSYELLEARIELDLFDGELGVWLASPAGRFAVYYAERERRRAA
jgi:hypothetical protein